MPVKKGTIALIIIFNYKYYKNIEILEEIYKNRFSNIFHLVPFYTGDKENVIPVYENSYNFQGYIAQGFRAFYNKEFTHYFFVADDLILNPSINENNFREHLHLNEKSCFLPFFNVLHKTQSGQFWSRVKDAYNFNLHTDGVEASSEIPDFMEAKMLMGRFGFEFHPLKHDQLFPKPKFPKRIYKLNKVKGYLKWVFYNVMGKSYELRYPLVGGYSDIFIISQDAIRKFCHYCGVFAATDLFVEIAIPTAIALSAEDVKTEEFLPMKGKALWTEAELGELKKYNFELGALLNDFPENYIYLHPVKLSKWKVKK
jgi:hypothetical protein